MTQQGTLRELTVSPSTPYVAELTGLNVLRGRADGSRLVLPDGTSLQLASAARGDVVAVIAPRDVALYNEAPRGSPRNAWRTRVERVHPFGDRERILLGDPVRITAEVTAAALRELGLKEGSPVWASVKATQIDVYLGDQ